MTDNANPGRIEPLEAGPEAILVLVSCDGPDEAEKIGRTLVAERLAAGASCAGPVRSVFRWEGKLESAVEHLLLIKTRADLFDDVARRVQELHSYELPEVIALPILAGSERYLKWIEDSTTAGPTARQR